MRVVRNGVAIAAIALLCACGDEEAPPSAPGGSAPPANLSLTPDISTVSVAAENGRPTRFSFTATVSGAAPSGVYADIDLGNAPLKLVGNPTLSGNKVTYTLETLPNLNLFGGSVTAPLRLCSNSSCSTVYAGSNSKIDIRYDAKITAWNSREQTTNSTGSIPVKFDATRLGLSKLVEENGVRYKATVATEGAVFAVGSRDADCDKARFDSSIDLSQSGVVQRFAPDGTEVWKKFLPDACYLQQIVAHRDRLLIPSVGGFKTVVLNAQTGQIENYIPRADATIGSPFGDLVYFATYAGATTFNGRQGVTVSAYDPVAGTVVWSREILSETDRWSLNEQAIAVEEQFLHIDLGFSLLTLRRSDGAPVRQIALSRNVREVDNVYSPILDADGNLFLSADYGPIFRIDAGANTIAWRSSRHYDGRPALADGKLFAQGESNNSIVTVNPQTGAVESEFYIDSTKSWNGPKSSLLVTSDYFVIGRGQFTQLGAFAVIDRNTGNAVYDFRLTGPQFMLTPDKRFVSVGIRAVSFHSFAP